MVKTKSPTKEKEPIERLMVSLPVKALGKVLYLHEQVAEGKYGDVEFTVDSVIPSRNTVVTIGDKQYSIEISDIVKSIVKLHESIED